MRIEDYSSVLDDDNKIRAHPVGKKIEDRTQSKKIFGFTFLIEKH